MKKLLSALLFAGILLGSCNNSTEVKEEVEETVEETTEEVSEKAEKNLPTFENEELDGIVEEFDVLFDEMMVAMKEGNEEALAALDQKGEALNKKMESLMEDISENDEATLTTYLEKKGKELMSLMNIEDMANAMEESFEEAEATEE